MDVLELMLGSAEYKPVVDEYRKKLRSSTALNQQFASQPPRKTSKYLCIIATKEAHQLWESECESDVKVFAMGACGTVSWLNGRCCNDRGP